MESQLVTFFFNLVFCILLNISQEIRGSPGELHKSETRLVVKFYLDFYAYTYVV